ncbi:MAG TPA: type II toxin-antitoxin system VapC family toxin [Acetobacteraceae bacterium]|nr:type II toxin-antitoxin system VapC family toxin [Acetobacteraceae bacterium]
MPALWPLEVAHVLMTLERWKVVDRARRIEIVGEFAALPIKVDSETAQRIWGGISGAAERHRLTVYDATYLELAVRLFLAAGDVRCGVDSGCGGSGRCVDLIGAEAAPRARAGVLVGPDA